MENNPKNNRRQILDMLAEGKIGVEEARSQERGLRLELSHLRTAEKLADVLELGLQTLEAPEELFSMFLPRGRREFHIGRDDPRQVVGGHAVHRPGELAPDVLVI